MTKVGDYLQQAKKASKTSMLEEALASQINDAGLPRPEREYRFAKIDLGRGWRFDFAWPDNKLAIEVEGGTWSGGRHTRGSGFAGDCEKYNAAAELGWTVLRYTGNSINNQDAIGQIRRVMEGRDEN